MKRRREESQTEGERYKMGRRQKKRVREHKRKEET